MNGADPSGLHGWEVPVQAIGALFDFAREWFRREHLEKTKNFDKYDHCMANCRASRRGEWGREAAELLSDARESYDVARGRNTEEQSADDQKANRYGRECPSEETEDCDSWCRDRYGGPPRP